MRRHETSTCEVPGLPLSSRTATRCNPWTFTSAMASDTLWGPSPANLMLPSAALATASPHVVATLGFLLCSRLLHALLRTLIAELPLGILVHQSGVTP